MNNRYIDNNQPPGAELVTLIGACIAIGLILVAAAIGRPSQEPVKEMESSPVEIIGSKTPELTNQSAAISGQGAPTPTTKPTQTPTPTVPTATPSPTPTPTVTPTPTLDLTRCNAAGCGSEAIALPTVEYDIDLLLRQETPTRRNCPECPKNEQLSEAELNALIAADPPTLHHLWNIALSQTTYELAPGIVYIVFDNAHHIVVDLAAPGYILRNIIPNGSERGTLITPSYCLSPQSLVVVDADYHGLNGSNKTETGRDLFFHLGRAALFKRDGLFDIDVIREREDYDRTTLSWGGGPIFMWDGRYNFNPEQEWFDQENLEFYRSTRWAKISVAVSKDRKYLFITASYGKTLEEHAENIINLGKKWGIQVDRAMRFDGGESAYMALRLGDYLVPILNIEEPLIVNCLAIERDN